LTKNYRLEDSKTWIQTSSVGKKSEANKLEERIIIQETKRRKL
jgi:hypothetical protein